MAYVDETGDTGDPTTKAGASSCYVLGCVLVDFGDWAAAFEELLKFRKGLRSSFGIPMRAEIKANYLVRSAGPLRELSLSPSQRQYVYREHLRVLERLPARAFAVVTDKARVGVSGGACLELTWEMLLQRLERTCYYDGTSLMISRQRRE